MAFASRPTKDEEAEANFRCVSDEDFARLSIEGKVRHIHLGMVVLTRTLVELAAATMAVNQECSAPLSGRPHGDE
jgi:hypothetical protein